MPFSPEVASVTRCTSHGAASDATFIDAKVSLIAVFCPKPDEPDDPSPFIFFFLNVTDHGSSEIGVTGIVGQCSSFFFFFLVLTGRTHSSPDAAFGVGGCSYVGHTVSFDSAMVPAFGHSVS